MTNKSEDSQIIILGIYKVKRSIKADEEEVISFGSSTTNTSSGDDLPF